MPKIVAKKEDWIKLGYKLFAEKGDVGIVIESMSKLLKCNKSSFYWHFKTKKNFINTLIDLWVENDTQQIMELTQRSESSKKKLLTLTILSYKQLPNLDFIFYLKRYGQKEQEVQDLIDKIDTRRIKFVEKLLKGKGYSKKKAKVKASLYYKHLIGYHEMWRYKKQSKDYMKEVLKELGQFINM